MEHKIQVSRRLTAHFSRLSLSYYLNEVVVNSQPEPKKFGEAADPWQRELIAPKIPAFEYLAGLNPGYYGPLSFFDVLARGHDKSSLEARLAMWLLLASKLPRRGYIVAADRDQGRLIVEAATEEWRHNVWMHDLIEIQKNDIIGPAGRVSVVASDARSAYGLRGDLLILDELTHWSKQDVWTAITSGRHKRPSSILCVLTNAGLLESWQHQAYLYAKSDPTWTVFDREGTLATWLKPEQIARDRRTLPPSEAKRLIDNKWIDAAEEADYLRRYECEACVDATLRYRIRREPGVENYVASIDYGARRDRTVLVVMHMDRGGRCVLDRVDVWQGAPGVTDRVQIDRVQDWMKDVWSGFRPQTFVVDPSQMEGTIQWAVKNGMPVEEFKSRSGHGNMELAQHLRAVIVERKLAWYPGCGQLGDESLVDELSALRVVRMPYGWRFDHENQKHDDRAVAIGMGALAAVRFPWFSPVTETAVLPQHQTDVGPVMPDRADRHRR